MPAQVGAPGVPFAVRLSPAAGRTATALAVAATAGGATLVGLALVMTLRNLATLPAGLAGSSVDRGPVVPLMAVLTAAAAVAWAIATARWLRRAARSTGAVDVRSLLDTVPGGGIPGAGAPGDAPRPAAHRVVGMTIVLAAAGIAGMLAGVAVRYAASDGGVARAGATIGLAGSVSLVVAAFLMLVVRGAVEVREVAAARRRGAYAEAAGVTPAWLALPVAGGTAALALLMVLAPVSRTVACDLAGPWSCSEVRVPADGPGDDPMPEVIPLSYAVHPAERPAPGVRRVLLVAAGGPGASGMSDGEWMVDWFPDGIRERFDIVTFDARGTGRTGYRDCEVAAGLYLDGDPTADRARSFVSTCLAEADVEAGDLARYSTATTVSDLEGLRESLGVESMAVYGISYGTVVAQAYAAAHPDRVSALVLDAPIDRALPAARMWTTAARGFVDVLGLVFAWCEADAECADALPEPEGAYARLRARLAGPDGLTADIRDSDGETFEMSIDERQFRGLVYSSLYDTTSRASLLRGLAALDHGDPRPLLRLYAFGGSEGGYGASSFAYYATWCSDVRVSPTDRTDDYDAFVAVARAAGIPEEIRRDIATTLAPCLYWPAQPARTEVPPDATGVPTLILSATADPVTPLAEARAIRDRVRDARLVETRGGGHGSLGWDCPNDRLEELLVNGRLPDTPKSSCDGVVSDAFIPLAASPAETAEEAALGLVWELLASPELQAWDGSGALGIGCAEGGVALLSEDRAAALSGNRSRVEVELTGCSWVTGAELDGSGWLDLGTWDADLDLTSGRGNLRFESSASGWRLDGTWDARPVHEDQRRGRVLGSGPPVGAQVLGQARAPAARA